MVTKDLIDAIGTDLPDRQAALSEAQVRALEALKEGFAVGEDRRDWVLVVRDDVGEPLMRLTLGEAAGPSVRRILT